MLRVRYAYQLVQQAYEGGPEAGTSVRASDAGWPVLLAAIISFLWYVLCHIKVLVTAGLSARAGDAGRPREAGGPGCTGDGL